MLCRIKVFLSVLLIAEGFNAQESSVCPWEQSGPDSVHTQNVLYFANDLSLGFFFPHTGLGWNACLI